MDSFQLNKIFGAFLAVVLVVMGLGTISSSLFHAEQPEKPGFIIEVAEASTGGASGGAAEAEPAIGVLLASASVDDGLKVAKKCTSCHTFEEGGANKVGPALYGILNKGIASAAGFGYSDALVAHGEGKQWSYEELNGFLKKPKDWVKGTSMGFAGLKKPADRANLIMYLRSLAATPADLPAAE